MPATISFYDFAKEIEGIYQHYLASKSKASFETKPETKSPEEDEKQMEELISLANLKTEEQEDNFAVKTKNTSANPFTSSQHVTTVYEKFSFKYQDEEQDWVHFSSEIEWNEVKQVVQQQSKNYGAMSNEALLRIRVTVNFLEQDHLQPKDTSHDARTIFPLVNQEAVAKFLEDFLKTPSSTNATPTPSHHFGVQCDGCKKSSFFGLRYRCSQCDNFDLCDECYPKRVAVYHHDPLHTFQLLPPPPVNPFTLNVIPETSIEEDQLQPNSWRHTMNHRYNPYGGGLHSHHGHQRRRQQEETESPSEDQHSVRSTPTVEEMKRDYRLELERVLDMGFRHEESYILHLLHKYNKNVNRVVSVLLENPVSSPPSTDEKKNETATTEDVPITDQQQSSTSSNNASLQQTSIKEEQMQDL